MEAFLFNSTFFESSLINSYQFESTKVVEDQKKFKEASVFSKTKGKVRKLFTKSQNIFKGCKKYSAKIFGNSDFKKGFFFRE